MRIQFQCNYDDFREASLGHAASSQRSKTQRSPWVGLVGWGVFVLMTVILTLVVRQNAPAQPEPPPAAPSTPDPTGGALGIRFLVTSAPGLFVMGLVSLSLLRQVAARPAKPWAPPVTSTWATILAVVLFVSLAVGIGLLNAFYLSARPEIQPTAYEYTLALVPFALLLVLAFALQAVANRRGMVVRWEAQAFLHRPHTLDASEAGLVMEEQLSRHDFHWDYFPGFRETANLFLLYVSPYSFWIVPKRAFPDVESLNSFKGFLLTHVKAGVLLPVPAAFPVLPVETLSVQS